jgi:hypothetical protein
MAARLKLGRHLCAYCGALMYKHRPPHYSLQKTTDHIFPQATHPHWRSWHRNRVKVCQGCNCAKGKQSPFAWVLTLRWPHFVYMIGRLRGLGVDEERIAELFTKWEKRNGNSAPDQPARGSDPPPPVGG